MTLTAKGGDRPLTDLSFAGIRVERVPVEDLETRRVVARTPRVVLMVATPAGRIREVELDRVSLAKLIAEAATANLILTNEEAPR